MFEGHNDSAGVGFGQIKVLTQDGHEELPAAAPTGSEVWPTAGYQRLCRFGEINRVGHQSLLCSMLEIVPPNRTFENGYRNRRATAGSEGKEGPV